LNKLLTIKDIAQALNIPESTARYYRDKWPEYVPTVGTGRNKRYKPEALEVLRLIAEGLRNGRSATEIENELSLKYQTITDIEPEPQQLPQQRSSSLELYRQDIDSRQDLAAAINALVEQNKILIEELQRQRKPWYKRIF
jgi:DNA-binding transcriptional MerR regulator